MMKSHFQNKVAIVDDVDRQIWELVTNVPHVGKPVAIVAAVLNFILPGFGTMVAACAASDTVSKAQLMIALFQFLTTFVLIGWIWAIYWGYLIVKKAMAVGTMHPPNQMGAKRDMYGEGF